MTQLGKPLVFYLKYYAEMQRLYEPEYEGGDPDLTDLDDAEQVRGKVLAVGAAASEQAADFLELCGKGIGDHIAALGLARIEKKRGTTFRFSQLDVGSEGRRPIRAW